MATRTVTFDAFPDLSFEIDEKAGYEGTARAALDTELGRLIQERLPIPYPSDRARTRGSPDTFEQMIVPTQAIALKALLWDGMRATGTSNSDLGRRLGLDEKEIRRLLDPEAKHGVHLGRAVEEVLGTSVAITVVDASPPGRLLRAAGDSGGAPAMNLSPALTIPGLQEES
jgi:antitoxin HicB